MQSALRFPFCPLLVLALLAVAPPPVTAQCAAQWQAGDGTVGTSGPVFATTLWDPDGAGPLPPKLAVGGAFVLAGPIVANHIALYDPATSTWEALGAGMNGNILALTTLPNGDLLAAGTFTLAGGVTASNVARWDGSTWTPVGVVSSGSALTGDVSAVAVMANGDLIAGGSFTNSGFASVSYIARWNGSYWEPLGAGVTGGVYALLPLANGDLIVAGVLSSAGGMPVNRVARWDGTSWLPLGTGVGSQVNALTLAANGDLVVGCQSSPYARSWNGTTWTSLGTGPGQRVNALLTLPNGDVVAGGYWNGMVSRWDGTSWSPIGTGFGPQFNSEVESLALLPNGDLIAAGSFLTANTAAANYIARWNGATWAHVSPGIDSEVNAILALPDGDVVIGGTFTVAGAVAANRIARWNGATWSPLGSGLNWIVQALTRMPNGDLIAGGAFTTAGGMSAVSIARWNGVAWAPLGSGMNYPVHALTVMPNGDLIAAGYFSVVGGVAANRIARWNGTTWAPLGSGMDQAVHAMVVLPNGDLVAGGIFTTAGGVSAAGVARWDGSAWSPLGSGLGTCYSLHVTPQGALVAGGWASAVRRWDGAAWVPLGIASASEVHGLMSLPSGDLVAGGVAVSGPYLSRWNGTTWTSISGGLGGLPANYISALALRADGELLVGGRFVTAGGLPSAYFARQRSTCPATASSQGTGCVSSGGGNTLTATTLPWVDATFRATGTGLPNLAIVVAVTSFTAIPQGALPLLSVFPQAPAGCDLLVAPDILQAYVTTTGVVESSLLLPNTPPIVGLTFRHQMIPIELDGMGNWVSITATNALQLTAGQF